MIKPPWTPEQVAALNASQKGDGHPFTCGSGNRTDEKHLDGEGVLVATEQGWMCPFCEYRQDWAHDFQAEKPAEVEEQEVITDAKARSILAEITSDEWCRPIMDHLAAKWAIERIAALENDTRMLRGTIEAQDGREQAAGVRCGVPYEEHGCDWPDRVADVIETLRFRLREQTAQTQETMEQVRGKIIAKLKRHDAIPTGLSLDEHPIEQIVGTCLAVLNSHIVDLQEALARKGR